MVAVVIARCDDERIQAGALVERQRIRLAVDRQLVVAPEAVEVDRAVGADDWR